MIVARFRQPRDFLGVWAATQGRHGGFFVESTRLLSVGAETPVEVRFADGRTFRCRCLVAWRRTRGGPRTPMGMGLEFLPSQRHVRDLILAHAEGLGAPYAPRHGARVPAQVKVRFKAKGYDVRGVTADISRDGLLMLTESPVPVGTEGVVTLERPGRIFGMSVHGVVVRLAEEGAMGIHLEPHSRRDRRRLTELVRDLRQRAPTREVVVVQPPE